MARACDALFPLPVEEKGIAGVPNDLLPLLVEEKVISRFLGMSWRSSAGVLTVAFSPYPSRKMLFQASGNPRQGCSRWPFHPACRGKANFRAPHEAQERPVGRNLGPLRLPFPSACRGKGNCRVSGDARNGLFPLPVEEKALSGFPQDTDDGRQL